MRRPLFLDRDGVLNKDVAPYLSTLGQLRIFPWTAESLAKLDQAGFDLYVVSNQQGVALGITAPEELERITAAIQAALLPHGFQIKKFYYSVAHDAEHHPWRKPLPGMIHAAAEEFGFEAEGAFLIGDWWKDVAAARAAGCRPLLVLSGVCSGDEWHSWQAQPEAVFPTLREAVDYVLKEEG